jgi:hypothetical protein
LWYMPYSYCWLSTYMAWTLLMLNYQTWWRMWTYVR